MKTVFHTLLKSTAIAMLLLASVFSLTASAATVTANMRTVNPDIKKVIVTGNTKVRLIQGSREYVTMDELDLSKVSVKQVGHTLTISSSQSNPVTVFVCVKNIYLIEASDHAVVETAGKFNLQNLQVMLKDDAIARVNVAADGLYTMINDRAQLSLIGTSASHISRLAGVAKIDTHRFAALKSDYLTVSDKVVVYNSLKN